MAIKNLAAIETALGMKAGEFETMYKSTDEVTVDIDKLEIMPKSAFEERLKNERKAEYDKGKNVGIEIKAKEVLTAFALDLPKETPMSEIAEKVTNSIISTHKLPVDGKVKELTEDKRKLGETIQELQGKITGLETGYKQKEAIYKVETTIKEKMPTNGMILEPNKLSILFKTEYNPKLNDEGKIVLHSPDGEVLKNKQTQNPLTIDEVLPDWQKPYVGKAGGGAGRGDESGNNGVDKSMDDFIKEMDEKGILANTPAFNAERRKRFPITSKKV